MKRLLPHLVLTVTMMIGGYLLALCATDLAQMLCRAYGAGMRSLIGGPVIRLACTFTQIKHVAVALPILLLVGWRREWFSEIVYVVYVVTWIFAILTWTFTVAYFSFQPGILG